ncbi:hypothetical protein SEA_HANNACONDA_60 [Mycobacterium phage Hannaconda]|nr:hypothetical protein SEA_HANNACONDA_60 [Mycobacterium phage Hannaconda]QPO16666.1 hypothetical protein SEA_KASHFLOW_57 [Mycobacterium phage KashFlow]
MCSPELIRGMCAICTGALAPDNTYVDEFGNRWDLHKGVCAMHAGQVPPHHAPMYWGYVARIHNAPTPEVRRVVTKSFYKWIKEVAEEDHHWEGPEE